MTGVVKAVFKRHRDVNQNSHPYARPLEYAILNGQAVYRLCKQLKEKGFIPDVVYAHSGWGTGQFIKDIFPDAVFFGYFEWYYRATGSDADFLPDSPLEEDDHLRVRCRNAPILLDLAACDGGVTPTRWQQQQFPEWMQNRMTVLHDGINTGFFAPREGRGLNLPDLTLPPEVEIITYVARGMEPYRGFPQFMAAVAEIQRRRPSAHVVVVGDDRVAYGRNLPDGQTYKQKMLAECQPDMTRLHFTGLLAYKDYLQVIQASDIHIYLTVPFVLSWSMLESMSTGCLILGSDTAPVRELITDGENGLLVDFFDVTGIADRVDEALNDPASMQPLRGAARQTILDNYDLDNLLPAHLNLLLSAAAS